jgi:amino acid transporter
VLAFGQQFDWCRVLNTKECSVSTTSKGPLLGEAAGSDQKKLGRSSIISLTVASFIPAAGMATVPLIMLGAAGYGSWLAAGISMIATIAIGMAIVVFARRFVASGSIYSYVGFVFGSWARYIVGGSLFIGYLVQLSSITLLMSVFGGSLLAAVGAEWALGPWPQAIMCAAILTAASAVVYRGLDVSVRVAVTLAAVSLPFMFVIVAGSAVSTGLEFEAQFGLAGASLPGIFTGMAAGAAFLFGFESSAALAGETEDPKRNVPWAVLSAPMLLGALYVVTTFLSVPGLLQASDAIAAGASAPAALAANAGLPTWLGTATDAILTIATLAGVIGFLNYGSRFAATLAGDGFLAEVIGRTHRRFGTPASAVFLLAGGALVFLVLLITVFSFSVLDVLTGLGILIVACWIFPYIIVCVGAFVLLLRARSLSVSMVAATVVGTATVGWVFLNNVLNPPPAPLNLVPYVFLGTLAIVMMAFAAGRRRKQPIDTSSTDTD